MSRSKPGLFVFAADWRAEPTLALCSEGARLLWWEMLLLMSEADPRGHLLVCGRAPDPRELAVLTRTDDALVQARLDELERNGVFSRTRSGAIYCRRIVRDEKTARLARQNGKKGGNPTLRNTKTIRARDNPPDNPPVNGRLKPIQNLTYPDSSLRSESSVPLTRVRGTAADAAPIDAKSALWTEMKARAGGNNPGSLIGQLIKDYGEGEVFRAHFDAMKENPADYRSWMAGTLKAREPKPEETETFRQKIHRRMMEKIEYDRAH